MKFNKNILIAGAAIVSMAACQSELKQPTDAEIDALVETKVTEVKNSLQQECDNSIMAMATAKADSTMVAAANKPARVIQAPAPAPKPAPKKAPVRKKVVTKKKEVTPPPPPPPPNQGKKNNAGGTNQGKKGNADAAKQAPQGQNMGKKK